MGINYGQRHVIINFVYYILMRVCFAFWFWF